MRFDIFESGKRINCIVATKDFCEKYCATNGYEYLEVEKKETSHPEGASLTRDDEIDAMIVEQEYRLTLIELGVNG